MAGFELLSKEVPTSLPLGVGEVVVWCIKADGGFPAIIAPTDSPSSRAGSPLVVARESEGRLLRLSLGGSPIVTVIPPIQGRVLWLVWHRGPHR